MNRIALIIITWALLTFSVEAQESTQQRIKIGVVYGFTGSAQVWSEYGRMGLELAQDEINSSGGIKGKVIELIFEDSKSNPTQSVTAYRKLVTINKVKIVLGNIWSFLTNPLIPLAAKDINVVKDFWPAISLRDQKFDLILCVQVLEHTSEPCSFLSTLSDSLDKNGEIYLEIPSGDWVVEHASIADIHYPHLSYFVTKVIYGIFEKVSLVPFATRNLLNGRDLGFVLRAIESVSSAKTLGSNADALASLLSKNIERTKSRIIRLSSKGEFAIYGANAGSQALFGFFPHIKPEFILDDTPSYVGAYGYNYESRFQILKPTVENLGRVQSVVIAAYNHDKVIAERLRALGFMGEIFSLRPESDLSGTVKSLFAS
ncbi:MAG: hypothetical protein EBX80_06290 [Acidimicrobiia bacterium]|nr:hypothetical protein [Acidimicrobiia bacterium]